ncbi:hypothetical protein [Streptomyces sp. NPDC005303]|uniref:hypothetical protein n=1 Tax=Streptomyces sp. NPDC005303 TaxID=3155713 RepID=UPI0033B0F19A
MSRVNRKIETCDTCGREVGEQSCRPVKLGWFCLMTGLQLDDSKLIHPAVEISREEQKAIDAFAPAIAAATKITVEAEAVYAQAERRYLDAARAAIKAGVDDAQTPMILSENLGPLGRDDGGGTLTADRGFVRKPVDAIRSARTKRENVTARESLADAEVGLRKARSALSLLENDKERAMRLARGGIDWSPLAPESEVQ